MERRRFLTATTVTLCGTVLAGCSGTDTDEASGGDGSADGGSGETTSGGSGDTANGGSGSDGGGKQETDQPDVKILDHSMEYDSMMGAKVVGTVKNTTDSELGYIQVKAKFFDDGGTRIGEGMWNATDVGAGKEVKFETIPAATDSEPAKYEIEAGTSLA